MVTRVEVFADITCPFTHLGLRRVVERLSDLDGEIEVVVRAWPLEWVNDAPLAADAVEEKIAALRTQLGTPAFDGFRADTWPHTTIPALNLSAAAFDTDPAVGLEVSLALRDALFEDGRDVSDADVLASIAREFDLDPPSREASAAVARDFDHGRDRGVRGSPDFWVGGDEFFCPALNLGRDDSGLTATFDEAGLDEFLSRVSTVASSTGGSDEELSG